MKVWTNPIWILIFKAKHRMIEVKYPDAEVDAAVGEADGGSVRNLHVTPQKKTAVKTRIIVHANKPL